MQAGVKVDRINVAAPYGDYPRLRGVELTARGLDRLLQPDISITQELRLPNFTRGDGEPFWRIRHRSRPWPKQMFSPRPGSSLWTWQGEAEERERRAREDNDRIEGVLPKAAGRAREARGR